MIIIQNQVLEHKNNEKIISKPLLFKDIQLLLKDTKHFKSKKIQEEDHGCIIDKEISIFLDKQNNQIINIQISINYHTKIKDNIYLWQLIPRRNTCLNNSNNNYYIQYNNNSYFLNYITYTIEEKNDNYYFQFTIDILDKFLKFYEFLFLINNRHIMFNIHNDNFNISYQYTFCIRQGKLLTNDEILQIVDQKYYKQNNTTGGIKNFKINDINIEDNLIITDDMPNNVEITIPNGNCRVFKIYQTLLKNLINNNKYIKIKNQKHNFAELSNLYCALQENKIYINYSIIKAQEQLIIINEKQKIIVAQYNQEETKLQEIQNWEICNNKIIPWETDNKNIAKYQFPEKSQKQNKRYKILFIIFILIILLIVLLMHIIYDNNDKKPNIIIQDNNHYIYK